VKGFTLERLRKITNFKICKFLFELAFVQATFHKFLISQPRTNYMVTLEVMYEMRSFFDNDDFIRALQ